MKMKKHFLKTAGFLALTTAMISLPQETKAAGFMLAEQSITGLGRSFAGAGIVGDDYSAIAYNPAGMTLLDSGMQIGTAAIWQHGEVKGSAANSSQTTLSGSEDVDILAVVPHFFGQYRINESFNIGLGIYVPFGLSSDYPDTWFGSDQGTLSSLESIDIAPSIAYRLNDQWSFGASFIARYGTMTLENTVTIPSLYGTSGAVEINADGWAYYGRFGVMYEHTKDTRFGLSYQTKSTTGHHTLKGYADSTTSLVSSQTVSATTILPEQLLLSGYTKHGKFGYSASLKYSRWEGFDEFNIDKLSGGTLSESAYNWQNTWTASVGLDYYHNDVWTFRGGVGFDESPYRSGEDRTVRIPENDRFWMSAGFSYKIDENMTIDVAYMHLYLPTYKANNSADYTGVDVKYDVNAEVFGVAFQYDF